MWLHRDHLWHGAIALSMSTHSWFIYEFAAMINVKSISFTPTLKVFFLLGCVHGMGFHNMSAPWRMRATTINYLIKYMIKKNITIGWSTSNEVIALGQNACCIFTTIYNMNNDLSWLLHGFSCTILSPNWHPDLSNRCLHLAQPIYGTCAIFLFLSLSLSLSHAL